jgi:hypothetical protein
VQGLPISLAISSSATALKVGETATLSFDFSAAPSGFAVGDITVAGGTLSGFAGSGTHYTATFTPTADVAEGVASISVASGSYSGTGNALGQGASAPAIRLDTLAPTLLSVLPEDNAFVAAGDTGALVATFSETVHAGTGSLRLVDDTGNTTTTFAIGSEQVLIEGNTLTLTPGLTLVAGHNYHVSIDNGALLDQAGNAYAGISNATTWNVAATNLALTLNPVAGDGRVNDGEARDTLQISGTVSSVSPAVLAALQASDFTINLNLPHLSGNGLLSLDKVLAATNVQYDNSTGVWTADVPATWQFANYFLGTFFTGYTPADTFVDGDSIPLSIRVEGHTGAANNLTVNLSDTLTVDRAAPNAPTLTLAADTGASNSDAVTREGLLNVGGLEPGGTWRYSLDGGRTWQTGAGSSFALTQDGATTMQVQQTDAAGNASALASLVVTRDTLASAPVIDTIGTHNHLGADAVGSAITGTAEAGATVSINLGGNTRTTTANGSGVWSYTITTPDLAAMGQGEELITATQTDRAGNVSSLAAQPIQVDSVRPTAILSTSTPSLLAGQQGEFTVTLSERMPFFDETSFVATGGAVGAIKVDASGLVYTGRFDPDPDRSTPATLQIDVGALLDVAGNRNTTASNLLSFSVNTVRPTVAVSSNAAGATLHAGDTATLNFTLSEASSSFTAADVTVVGGTLSNFAGSGSSYTATFTPDANSRAPASVSVADGKFSNAAGNSNADGGEADNRVDFSVATVQPTVAISSDRSALGAEQAATVTFAFSEDPGSSFSLADITVVGGTLGDLQGAGRQQWASFTPTPGFSGPASITVAGGSYASADGSSGLAGSTPELVVDTVAPTVAISRSGSGMLLAGQTDTITFTFSEAPGSSFSASDVLVSGGTLGSLVALSPTQYSASLTPNPGQGDGVVQISLASNRFADAAGNVNTDGEDVDNRLLLGVDNVAPTVQLLQPLDNATLADGGSISLAFSEAIAYGGSGITLVDDSNGGALVAISASVNGSTLSITPNVALVAGHQYHVEIAERAITDTAGNAFAGISGSTAWNFSAAAAAGAGTVDSTIASVTGDNHISAAEAAAGFSVGGRLSTIGVSPADFSAADIQVSLLDASGTVLQTVSASSYDPGTRVWSASLAAGSYTDGYHVVAVAITGQGAASGVTGEVKATLVVDTAVAAPTAVLAQDTGISATDRITNNGSFNVVGLEEGASAEYLLPDSETWIPFSGSSFSLSSSGVYDGIRVRQIDRAGNVSAPSSFVDRVDYRARLTTVPSASLATDSGSSNRDNITNIGTVNVSGLAGDTWAYSTDGGLTFTAGSGSSFTVSGDGTHKVSVRVTDAAGNGASDRTLQFDLDTVAPSAPKVTLTAATDDGGAIEQPTNLEQGATVQYRYQQGSGTYSTWSTLYTPPTAGGSYTLQARQVDVAGNASTSTELSFSVVANITTVQLSDVAAGTGGFVINGQYAGDESGYSVTGAGDVNGDGLADLIIGAPNYETLAADDSQGRSYVVFGKTGSTAIDLAAVANGTGGFVITGRCKYDNSGQSVTGAGDLNGDGLADLIVGAGGANNNAGRTYVVFGKSTGTAVDLSALGAHNGPGYVISGGKSDDNTGFSVSSAGDVNGDGLQDLIIGAYGYDTASSAMVGRSYVVLGRASSGTLPLPISGGLGFAITGESQWDYSGRSVSAAGDVNGDGLADLIVGALYAEPAGLIHAGRSYVVFGKTSGAAANLSDVAAGSGGFAIDGASSSDQSGYSVSSAGDVNGDGLADLIVGARWADTAAGWNAGRSYVVFGQSGGNRIQLSAVAAGTGGFVIDGASLFDESGTSVSAAGDINGDGLADLLVGAPGSVSYAGRSYVVYGKSTGAAVALSAVASGQGGFAVDGGAEYAQSGTSVSAAGDVNGDGLADLVIGAFVEASSAGRSYVVFGSSAGVPGTGTLVTHMGTSGNDTLTDSGSSSTLVAGAGNDALSATAASVLLGGSGNDTFTINSTMAFGLQAGLGSNGNTTRLARVDGGSGTDTLVLEEYTRLSLIQVAFTAAGNPQASDRLAGIERIDISARGSVVALSAAEVALLGSNNSFNSGNGWAGLGASVPRHQLVVSGTNTGTLELQGSWNYVGRTTDGQGNTFYAYNGAANTQLLLDKQLPGTQILLADIAAGSGGFVINGQSAGDYSGVSVSSVGDFNGDGLADVIVGALQASTAPRNFAGRSYLVFGRTAGTPVDLSDVAAGNGGLVINGQSAGHMSGWAVSSAGDVNGDGLTDLIVGAKEATERAGRSYVVFGRTAVAPVELTAIAAGVGGFAINGQFANDASGYSVSSAGDVNGDGMADLIVGAKSSTPAAGTSAGRSYVVFGKTAGSAIELSAVAAGRGGFMINGQCRGDESGSSVSSAGDVNGDGLADLIVGAPNSDTAAGDYAGRSYVVFGKSSTTAVDLSAVANGTSGFVINGQSGGDWSGDSVSSAGDVNGDGLADLIVGADDADPAFLGNAGRSYVVFGQSTTTAIHLSAVASGTGGFVINGQCGSSYSGSSVSNAGDINGDGLADLIVGASQASPPSGYAAGRSYVVFGTTAGTAINLSAVAAGRGGFAIDGQTANDGSGVSVSAAGDVNGDGLADLVVGANFSDPVAGANAGRSYVIFGSTTSTFLQGNTVQMGGTGNDTLNDNGSAKLLLGDAGNDTLTATAPSVLRGGVGDDTFVVNQTFVTALQTAYGQAGNNGALNASIDGGDGGIDSVTGFNARYNVDTLRLSGSNINLDLTRIGNIGSGDPSITGRLANIEVIDLATGNNSLKLTARDVLDVSDAVDLAAVTGTANANKHQLVVMGSGRLDLSDGGTNSGTAGWANLGTRFVVSGNDWGYAGLQFDVWKSNTSAVQVLVQQGIVVG